MNSATVLGGPALVRYRGASFYAQGNIVLNSNKDTFAIEVDRFGKVDERVSAENLTVNFTPAGEWESLTVLWPYASTLLGSLIAPHSQLVSAINTTTNALTITGHGLATADDVLVHVDTGGALPTATPALSNSTRYYVRAVDADTLKLYTSASDASSDTSAIDFTAAGTGNFYVDRDHPLTIHTFAGIKLVLYNAAVSAMPGISFSATKTLIGAVTFEAFLRNGTAWSDSAARWVITNEALSDTSFDPANIKCKAASAAWGVTAPWDSFQTAEGWEIGFTTGLAAVMTDELGVLTRRLSNVEVTARAQPVGIDESQLLTKLLLQNTGSVRGRSLAGDDLVLSATGVSVTLTSAALKTAPQNFSASQQRIGQLEWVACRKFSAGVPQPLFAVA